MGENGKEELKDFPTLALIAKMEYEEDDEKWGVYWAELLTRTPFQELDECLQDALEKISLLEDRQDKLMQLFKNHEHLHGNVMVKI